MLRETKRFAIPGGKFAALFKEHPITLTPYNNDTFEKIPDAFYVFFKFCGREIQHRKLYKMTLYICIVSLRGVSNYCL